MRARARCTTFFRFENPLKNSRSGNLRVPGSALFFWRFFSGNGGTRRDLELVAGQAGLLVIYQTIHTRQPAGRYQRRPQPRPDPRKTGQPTKPAHNAARATATPEARPPEDMHTRGRDPTNKEPKRKPDRIPPTKDRRAKLDRIRQTATQLHSYTATPAADPAGSVTTSGNITATAMPYTPPERPETPRNTADDKTPPHSTARRNRAHNAPQLLYIIDLILHADRDRHTARSARNTPRRNQTTTAGQPEALIYMISSDRQKPPTMAGPYTPPERIHH